MLNILDEYVSFSKKAIYKYLKMILGHYFDQDIYDDLINAYINVRYYNLYPKVEERFEENIVYYLKKSLIKVKDDARYHKKAKYMFTSFQYILYFDKVIECDSVRKIISKINNFRKEIELDDDNFEANFYNLLKSNLEALDEFVKKFQDKNFNVEYVKIRNEVFDCKLNSNVKFSKIYSEYAINKVLGNKDILEQNLFVLYSLVGVKILNDVIKGIFDKYYLVDYAVSLKDKQKKQKRLFNLIDNDVSKEKLIFKITYSDYLENKDDIYDLTKEGFQIGICLDEKFILTEDTYKLLKVFTYIITDDSEFYSMLKNSFPMLYIPR